MVEQEAEAVIKYSDRAKIQEIGKDVNGRSRFMIYITGICREADFKKGDILMVSVNKIGYKAPKCNNPFLKKTGGMNNMKVALAERNLKNQMETEKVAPQPSVEKEDKQAEYGEEIIK